DLMWDDDELRALFSKQRETSLCLGMDDSRRREAVEWILRINSHYGFSPSTAILAVDYLDRFISSRRYSFQCDDDDDNKPPWMMQLTAVASLSLAAKLEETHVPLLLDFQVEGAKYIFEAKTIQKMELLILSTLKWRMSSVTPLSFIDHCIRRLGLPKTQLFLRRCQNLLLLALPDSRFLWFPPSVLGGAAMIYVIHEGGGSGFFVDQVALASMLRISKDQVWRCYHFLSDISSN
ncbi:cyclin d3, partial [Genlisea aurea]